MEWTDFILFVQLSFHPVRSKIYGQTCMLIRLRHEITLPLSVPILKRAPVWTPYQKGAQDDLEKVKRRAARWICVKWDKVRRCWSKTYEECAAKHQLLSCCQTFKIIHNLDCLNFNDYLCFNQSSTSSHSLTLRCARSRIRHSFFVNIPFL